MILVLRIFFTFKFFLQLNIYDCKLFITNQPEQVPKLYY